MFVFKPSSNVNDAARDNSTIFVLFFLIKAKMWAISSDTHQLNYIPKHHFIISNYNRARYPSGRLCVWPCVWQSTPRTADVTVTNIAGYVRVRILMNR